MRKCPKCGAQYADDSLLTMCSACMTTLVTVNEPAETATAPAPAPIMPVVPEMPVVSPVDLVPSTAVMPETPVILPEVPQIPPIVPPEPEIEPMPFPTPPEPGPMPPPMTPQPAPMPGPPPPIIPQPQPAPVPAPTRPQPMPQPMPQPGVPAQPGSGTSTYTPLSEMQIGSSKAYAGLMIVLSIISAFITLRILVGTTEEDFNLGTLIGLALFTFVTVICVRQAIFRSAISAVKIELERQPRLGEPLLVKVTIGVIRDLPITDATLTLKAQEIVDTGGRNNSRSTREVYSRLVHITTANRWTGGREITLHAELPITADAMPTYAGNTFKLGWSLALWVGIPGWYPDIRNRLFITVPPIRALDKPRPSAPRKMNLVQLTGLNAHLTLDCPVDEYNTPLLPVGQLVPFTMQITPQQPPTNQKMWLELGYTIEGSAVTERAVLSTVPLFPGGWTVGNLTETQGTFLLPPNIPLSYRGQLMNVRWTLTIFRRFPPYHEQAQAVDIIVAARDSEETGPQASTPATK